MFGRQEVGGMVERADDEDDVLSPSGGTNDRGFLSRALARMYDRMTRLAASGEKQQQQQQQPQQREVLLVGDGRADKGCCRGPRCGPCTWLLVLVLGLALLTAVVFAGVSMSGTWRVAQATGDGLAALFTHVAALQSHRRVWQVTDPYGDPMGADTAAMEPATRALGLIQGSVDVHARRVDWTLRVSDPNARLTTLPRIVLWVQRYDATGTSPHFVHTRGSPFALCEGVAMQASVLTCAGVEQNATRLPDNVGADDSLLTLAVFASDSAPEPEWLVTL